MENLLPNSTILDLKGAIHFYEDENNRKLFMKELACATFEGCDIGLNSQQQYISNWLHGKRLISVKIWHVRNISAFTGYPMEKLIQKKR